MAAEPTPGPQHVMSLSECTDALLLDLLPPQRIASVTYLAHRSADPVLAANQSLLAGFLESCDLAKFGGWNLSIHDMEAMLQGARRFIVESAAQSAEPNTGQGPAKPTISPASSSVSETSSVTPRDTYGSLPST